MKQHAIKLRQFFSTKKIAACLAYFSTRFKSLNQLSNGISRRKKSATEKVHFFDQTITSQQRPISGALCKMKSQNVLYSSTHVLSASGLEGRR